MKKCQRGRLRSHMTFWLYLEAPTSHLEKARDCEAQNKDSLAPTTGRGKRPVITLSCVGTVSIDLSLCKQVNTDLSLCGKVQRNATINRCFILCTY
jgi:hypothetical protein